MGKIGIFYTHVTLNHPLPIDRSIAALEEPPRRKSVVRLPIQSARIDRDEDAPTP